jgi:hypothetical protein
MGASIEETVDLLSCSPKDELHSKTLDSQRLLSKILGEEAGIPVVVEYGNSLSILFLHLKPAFMVQSQELAFRALL